MSNTASTSFSQTDFENQYAQAAERFGEPQIAAIRNFLFRGLEAGFGFLGNFRIHIVAEPQLLLEHLSHRADIDTEGYLDLLLGSEWFEFRVPGLSESVIDEYISNKIPPEKQLKAREYKAWLKNKFIDEEAPFHTDTDQARTLSGVPHSSPMMSFTLDLRDPGEPTSEKKPEWFSGGTQSLALAVSQGLLSVYVARSLGALMPILYDLLLITFKLIWDLLLLSLKAINAVLAGTFGVLLAMPKSLLIAILLMVGGASFAVWANEEWREQAIDTFDSGKEKILELFSVLQEDLEAILSGIETLFRAAATPGQFSSGAFSYLKVHTGKTLEEIKEAVG